MFTNSESWRNVRKTTFDEVVELRLWQKSQLHPPSGVANLGVYYVIVSLEQDRQDSTHTHRRHTRRTEHTGPKNNTLMPRVCRSSSTGTGHVITFPAVEFAKSTIYHTHLQLRKAESSFLNSFRAQVYLQSGNLIL